MTIPASDHKSLGQPGTGNRSNRRQYLRLDTVLPVEFRLVSCDGKHFLSEWFQGFTNNIGKGGICLTVNRFSADAAEKLASQKAQFSLEIETPFTKRLVSARGAAAWMRQDTDGVGRYLFGVRYEQIDAADGRMLLRFAWTRVLTAPIVAGIFVLLGAGLLLSAAWNARLVSGNQQLISQLVKVSQETSAAEQQIHSLSAARADLQQKLQRLEVHLNDLEAARTSSLRQEERLSKLNTLIGKLLTERSILQHRLQRVRTNEAQTSTQIARLVHRKAVLEKANIQKMYQWLAVHQNPRTGLVLSFEGDDAVGGWAFVYDQALAVQAYLLFNDAARARNILAFFAQRAKRIDGRFVNAYYFNDGTPAEYVVHAGPNIWLGIAALQYTRQTGDETFLPLAQEIAAAILQLQQEDDGGGIRGGPNVSWFATEHNLDAYAFYRLLSRMTGHERYQQAAERVLSWLQAHTYDRGEVPVQRGKGDATVATDTYAWSIASIGPEKLSELGMDPQEIMAFAETQCGVEVSYVRPEGAAVRVRGFDFAAQRHLARGGIVSPEWTAQMVVSYQILSRYFASRNEAAKAALYAEKASAYLNELAKMVISSPSPSGQGQGCLPYASEQSVDTGHGWVTPKGKATGSVAGTAYTLFAYYGYNPLQFSE